MKSPVPNYGLATGLMNAIGGLGAGSAILIAGIWRSSLGIEPLMRGCLVLSMSCAILLFFLLRARFEFERKLASSTV